MYPKAVEGRRQEDVSPLPGPMAPIVGQVHEVKLSPKKRSKSPPQIKQPSPQTKSPKGGVGFGDQIMYPPPHPFSSKKKPT